MAKKIVIIQYTKKIEDMKVKDAIAGILAYGGNRGERITGAGIYLETGTEQQLIAFQKTGESGKVTFAHLDKGTYRILLEIPYQTGKLEVKEAWFGDIQVGYHSEKKMFVFQEASGYFSVRFTRLNHLANSNITPMHDLDESQRKNRTLIGKLEIIHNYGSLTLELAAHSQRKFQKLIEKYKNDPGMSVIRKTH